MVQPENPDTYPFAIALPTSVAAHLALEANAVPPRSGQSQRQAALPHGDADPDAVWSKT